MATPLSHVAGEALDAEALARLRDLAGPDATFREHQREAVADLVVHGRRVLCVQRTGWGKSAVYFVATALLRRGGSGPTLLVSPLLALMRNQIAAAERLGLRAHTVNSTNREEWEHVQALLRDDAVDLLLVSPERLNNPGFRERMMPLFTERVGLLVVDEAHCVSDWGHDFRPDYRRIRDLLAALGPGVPVLCTTATANDRVVGDVEEQLAVGAAAPLVTYRGALGRASLRLEVVELASPAARLAWLATHLPALPGSGIVYCLTKRDTELVADWLNAHGVVALAYSGDVDERERVRVEDRLLAGDVKAVVATSALGMGYDKPDLGWVVHYQAPGSAIAYYQQVGRAGRAVERADVVLLRGAEDRDIQSFFIESAFPPRALAEAVLAHVEDADQPASVNRLMTEVNLGKTRLEGMLKVLDVEGAVRRRGSGWERTDAPWVYDAARYEQVTELRRAEQRAMAGYGGDGRCLMRALREELDDPGAEDCGRCAVCTAPRFAGPLDPRLVALAETHVRGRPLVVDVRKMTPATPDGPGRRIPVNRLVEEGRALGRAGDGGWGALVNPGAAGDAPLAEELVAACAELVSAWGPSPSPGWVTAVPSRRRPTRVPGFARRLAEALDLPYVELLERAADGPPQREMRNGSQQFANVRAAFRASGPAPAGAGLLVDDVRGSGWTLAVAGGQLRRAGADAVHPLVLALA